MKVWQYDSCRAMMNALGFGSPFEVVGENGQARLVLGLKSLPKDLKKIAELPFEIVNTLRKRRFELEEELITIEGSPSVAAAVRELRIHHTIEEVRGGLETALTIVRNVLTQPKDIRMYRIKKGNPNFHRNLGRLTASSLLMNAIGFVIGGTVSTADNFSMNSESVGSVYVLKALNADKDAAFDATNALLAESSACKDSFSPFYVIVNMMIATIFSPQQF